MMANQLAVDLTNMLLLVKIHACEKKILRYEW